MGLSKKHQGEGGKEVDGKKWVIAGITIRAPLKSISTTTKANSNKKGDQYEEDDGVDGRSKTPTARESRIPERLPCPPAPRKRRSTTSTTCHFINGGNRDFFIPPDLETVFVRHVERAS